MGTRRVIFLLFDSVHLLDLAGAVTVFYESGCCGHPYELKYVSPYRQPVSSAGLMFTQVDPLESVQVEPEDILIVAGMDLTKWDRADDGKWVPWLQTAARAGATICSVCTAAFALAAAGLLHGRNCTTHWAYTKKLQADYPDLQVQENRLFVKSDRIYTSAGISTGIDLALFLVEEDHGPDFACTVAKDMVIYIRRDGEASQQSVYLQYRQHINHQVHQVQDYIAKHLHEKLSLTALATLVYSSPRNLTRLFKAETGVTIGQYIRDLREEKARQLLKEDHKASWIAKTCGISDIRLLRTLARKEGVALNMA
ncbi:transcriptional regulator GlxA family with amidase domain [Chitinophaga dinghuensis]|uniref:Transcriptional regulator GlxA family with amidase domain n=1 Tax=Chitinophaga dinghuensis TaxID=1539050 RepID=A0A327VY76_9BACT|nr:DJ-1/PfpI family protein [Chitinophaga dinghuensis]RAJ81919.1 transcriptional regulator GlxA family with amidase domain [Chitinophaga dinghuensis]